MTKLILRTKSQREMARRQHHFPFSTSFSWPDNWWLWRSPTADANWYFFSYSLCSFDNSLLPLWSSSWTAQSIARHNTNKKFLFCFFGDDESVEKEKINKRVILAEEEIQKFSEFISLTSHTTQTCFITLKLERRKHQPRIISHFFGDPKATSWRMKRSKKTLSIKM